MFNTVLEDEFPRRSWRWFSAHVSALINSENVFSRALGASREDPTPTPA
ncbi:MAG: hypothetical protein ACTMIK_11785 [Galactobacter sp.]